jgi:hypothetical protein
MKPASEQQAHSKSRPVAGRRTAPRSRTKPVEAIALEPAPPALAPPRDDPSRPSTAEAADRHRRMVAEAAYFLAQKRGFCGGDPQEDWYIAEREIARAMGKTSL